MLQQVLRSQQAAAAAAASGAGAPGTATLQLQQFQQQFQIQQLAAQQAFTQPPYVINTGQSYQPNVSQPHPNIAYVLSN